MERTIHLWRNLMQTFTPREGVLHPIIELEISRSTGQGGVMGGNMG